MLECEFGMNVSAYALSDRSKFLVDMKYPAFTVRLINEEGGSIEIHTCYGNLEVLEKALVEKMKEFRRIRDTKCREG